MFTLDSMTQSGKDRKRRGRGGSRGGTSGKGHKGQKARSGKTVRVGFEGGQMPLFRRLPKRGFTNLRFAKEVQEINLGMLENFFDEGEVVSRETLIEKGIIKAHKSAKATKGYRIKLLGNGQLSKKLTVIVDACSASARKAIEDKGGEVQLTTQG